MNRKVISPLLIFVFLVLFFRIPLVTNQPQEYRISETGKVEEVPVASTSTQTASQVFDHILGANKPSPTPPSSAFARWSILENSTAGYRLVYPAGFTVNTDYAGKVEVTPPSHQGTIIVYIQGDTFEVKTFSDGVTGKDLELLTAAATMIQDNFEFITNPGYNPDEIHKRFSN